MGPQAKRRRRNPVEDSDDEGDQPRGNTLTDYLVTSPTSVAARGTSGSSPSPKKTSLVSDNLSALQSPKRARRTQQQPRNPVASSPKKTRAQTRSEEKSKSADLKTLFTRQAQQPTRLSSANDKRKAPVADIVSDPISGDDEISELKTSSSSLVGEHARKRVRKGAEIVSTEPPTETQRFLLSRKDQGSVVRDDDLRPWSERFGPRNLEELAVHKKKVSDVRRWIEHVIAGALPQRVLILKGAAGSGKTTTVRLLAQDMGCELLEWKNPAGSSALGYVSTSAQFDDFLGRGSKFGTLDLEDPSPSSSSNGFNDGGRDQRQKIILIEEFPNTFSRTSPALISFQKSILQCLAAPYRHQLLGGAAHEMEPINPVVLIITETLLTTTSATADSFTAHRLLGSEILRHPGVTVIEFNPIAPTILTKALELVVQKEARSSGRRRTPGPQVLKRLGDVGDIRNAISSLEFLCVKGDDVTDWGGKVNFKKQKRGVRDAIDLTQGEVESLISVSQREASLGIFHAVGKVVYNKRDDHVPSGGSESVEKLPPYLSHHARTKRSQVDVESLIDEIGTDTHTFTSALHENYVLSCENAGPMDLSTSMDYVNECIEYLSLGDLLCPSRDVFFGGGRADLSGRDSGGYFVRQDEMMFQVAVRGILFSLPHPVKRKTTTTRGGDTFKMFYPSGLKLWREKEEVEDLVELWSSKLLKEETLSTTREETDGATTLFKSQTALSMDPSGSQRPRRNLGAADPDEDPRPLSLGNVARREMLMDRLPYMAQLARFRKPVPIRLRDLEKVVAFHGIAAPTDEALGDEAVDDSPTGEAWATDRPSEETPRKQRAGLMAGTMSGLLAQKLVLSDDDIED